MDKLPTVTDREDEIIDYELMPESLQEDKYFVLNDEFVQQKQRVHKEMLLLMKEQLPWMNKCCKMAFENSSIKDIAKITFQSQRKVNEYLSTLAAKKVIAMYQAIDLINDGPNELLRKNKLWRIAVDQEEIKPELAIKAVAELNRMSERKAGGGIGGGAVNIIINNAVLQKGALD